MQSKGLLISFPKSGRTWLRHMLAQLGLAFDYWHAHSSHRDAVHRNDLSPDFETDHHRILVLLRDPRDAAVSGFHTVKKRADRPYGGSMEDFLQDPRHGIEKAATFNLMWAQWAAARDDAAIVTYESLRTDTLRTLEAVLAFFQARPGMLRTRFVVWLNDFERTHRWDRFRTYLKRGVSDRDALKARRGMIGSHADELTSAERDYCDSVLERLDYFPRIDRFLAMRGLAGPPHPN